MFPKGLIDCVQQLPNTIRPPSYTRQSFVVNMTVEGWIIHLARLPFGQLSFRVVINNPTPRGQGERRLARLDTAAIAEGSYP